MSSQEHITLLAENNLTESEIKKRSGLASRKPYIAKKLANISSMEERGEISPIIRIEKSYLCNFPHLKHSMIQNSMNYLIVLN